MLLQDPREAMAIVGKKVSLEVCPGHENPGDNKRRKNKASSNQIIGYLKTIDPVSGSFVIINFDSQESDDPQLSSVTIVLGKNVKSVTLEETNEKISALVESQFQRKVSTELSPEELKERKDRIAAWIGKNQIPFEERSDGTLIILHQTPAPVTVSSPFGQDDILCSNDTVLGRMRSIIASMPSN
jgi:hypothetical protein